MRLKILFVLLIGWGSLWAVRPDIREKINWVDFMERQDMTWEVLPKYWYEAPFMGNGTLGLMIYQEPGQNCIRLETGNSDAHDHRPERGTYGTPHLMTGHFALRPQGEILSGNMRLRLWDALTEAEIITTKGKIYLTAWVHADNMVMVVKGRTEGNESYTLEWVPASADSPRYLYSQTKEGSWVSLNTAYKSNPKAEVVERPDGGSSLQKLLYGGETATYWQEMRKRKNHTLWMSLVHTYPQADALDKARTEVENAVRKGYDEMLDSHRQWWHRFYPKSFLTLEDTRKENFYWIQLYKLASATRADRALIDNTGPWLTVTPWPNAWWNLNVQLTYWTLNASNHLDLAESLEHAIYDHVDNLRDNLPEAYRHDALGIGCVSNEKCFSEQVGIPGKDANAQVGLLPWACHNLWLIYRHKMDDALLRDHLFPVLKGAINYYLHFLHKEEDGKYHLPRTFSPEYGSTEDCNFDLALLNWGCGTLLQICDRLHIEDKLIPTWKDVLENITPYPTDENGLMIGQNTPYVKSHRHYSHLLAAYPLYQLNIEQEGSRELIEKTLKYWQSKPATLEGYSSTGASSISSALGNGNEALRYLDQLFSDFLSPNTFYKEAGPVIETPLSGAQSIHDMLLQSWGNKLRIFPAIPDAWANLTYHNWRAEGAFLVSAQRKGGKTGFIRIYSEAGEPCVLVTDLEDPVFEGERAFHIEKTDERTYRIDLKKGEEVFIHARGEKADYRIKPLEASKANYFGKKQQTDANRRKRY